jgi:hypothetical protein
MKLLDRIRRTLSEPRQVLWVMDQDAWAKGLDHLGQIRAALAEGSPAPRGG